jgi:hypothetical protein
VQRRLHFFHTFQSLGRHHFLTEGYSSQGGPYLLPPERCDTFLAYNRQNLARLSLDAEFTVIHDPQPVAMIQGRNNRSEHWIWRCHIDLICSPIPAWPQSLPGKATSTCASIS